MFVIEQRFCALLTAFALVGGNLFTAAHHVAERHERCAEHGELIHEAVSQAGTVQAVSPGSLVPAPIAEPDAHEHCTLLTFTETERVGVDGVSTSLGQSKPAPVLECYSFIGLFAALELAPKTSPPV